MKQVCIVVGFTEGPWQTKQLKKSLKNAGFGVTKNVNAADVIVAHSGGCYTIPPSVPAKFILLVGVPHWPGKHLAKGLAQKVIYDEKNLWWFKKTAFNTYYLLSRPRKWAKMVRRYSLAHLPTGEPATIIAIRNKYDHFMHPTESQKLARKLDWQFEALNGHHDDLWQNPEPYVKLIQSLYE